jgi:hypothetical protein
MSTIKIISLVPAIVVRKIWVHTSVQERSNAGLVAVARIRTERRAFDTHRATSFFQNIGDISMTGDDGTRKRGHILVVSLVDVDTCLE